MKNLTESLEWRPLKQLSFITSGDQPDAIDLDPEGPFLLIGGGRAISRSKKFNTKENTIVIGRVGSSGNLYWANEPTFVTDNGFKLRAYRFVHPKWLYYALHTVDWNFLVGGTAQPLLTGIALKNARIPSCLHYREQQRIADYLDHETAEIDAFVASLEDFYRLANERHLAEVENEVWNEEYPLVRIKFFTDVLPGFSFKSSDYEEHSEGTVRLLRGINVTPGEINWGNCVALPESESKSYYEYLLRAGDFVLGLDRPIVGSGLRLAEIDEESEGSLLVQRVARIRLTSEMVLRRWLYAALQGTRFEAHLTPSFTGVSVPHMSPGQLENFAIPVPLPETQNAKLRILSRASEQQALLEKDISAAIDLARERRAALITAAVTGQIDVTAKNKPAAEQIEDDVAQGLHREYA